MKANDHLPIVAFKFTPVLHVNEKLVDKILTLDIRVFVLLQNKGVDRIRSATKNQIVWEVYQLINTQFYFKHNP